MNQDLLERLASAINTITEGRRAVAAAFEAEFPEYIWTFNAKGHVEITDPQPGVKTEVRRATFRTWPA